MVENALYKIAVMYNGVVLFWDERNEVYVKDWQKGSTYESADDARNSYESADPIKKYEYGHLIWLYKVEPRPFYCLEGGD